MPTTLLAVDDSVTMRKVLEMTFAGEPDFRVVTADGVDAGLAKLRSERPSLVFADASLDGQGGYGLCSRIKAESPGTLVIVLSSKQQPYDQAKGTAARADDFIDKPFDTQQLIDKVKKLVLKVAPEPVRQTGAYPAPPAAAAASVPQRPAAAPATPPAGATAGGARPPIGPRPTAPGIAAASQVGRGTLAYVGLPGSPQPGQAAPPAAPAAPPRPPVPTAQAAPPAPVTQQTTPGIPAVPHRPAAPAAPLHPPAVAPVAAAAAAAVGQNGTLAGNLAGLGLTEAQVTAVLALSRDVIEKVVWEIVPVLAETIIKEEIKRLTSE